MPAQEEEMPAQGEEMPAQNARPAAHGRIRIEQAPPPPRHRDGTATTAARAVERLPPAKTTRRKLAMFFCAGAARYAAGMTRRATIFFNLTTAIWLLLGVGWRVAVHRDLVRTRAELQRLVWQHGYTVHVHDAYERIDVGGVAMPIWTPALVTAILPTIWLAVTLTRRLRRGIRRRTGLCEQCGYDLRASPDRCPECGSVPTAQTARLPGTGG